MRKWVELDKNNIETHGYRPEFLIEARKNKYIFEILQRYSSSIYNVKLKSKRPGGFWSHLLHDNDIITDYDPREIEPLDETLFKLN